MGEKNIKNIWLLVLVGANYILFRVGVGLNLFGGFLDQTGAFLCWATFGCSLVLVAVCGLVRWKRPGKTAVWFVSLAAYLAIFYELFIAGS